jgi:hypothetical protein
MWNNNSNNTNVGTTVITLNEEERLFDNPADEDDEDNSSNDEDNNNNKKGMKMDNAISNTSNAINKGNTNNNNNISNANNNNNNNNNISNANNNNNNTNNNTTNNTNKTNSTNSINIKPKIKLDKLKLPKMTNNVGTRTMIVLKTWISQHPTILISLSLSIALALFTSKSPFSQKTTFLSLSGRIMRNLLVFLLGAFVHDIKIYWYPGLSTYMNLLCALIRFQDSQLWAIENDSNRSLENEIIASRTSYEFIMSFIPFPPITEHSVSIPSRTVGHRVPLLIFRPNGTKEIALPVVLYMHGEYMDEGMREGRKKGKKRSKKNDVIAFFGTLSYFFSLTLCSFSLISNLTYHCTHRWRHGCWISEITCTIMC